jgi:hypothetical protein
MTDNTDNTAKTCEGVERESHMVRIIGTHELPDGRPLTLPTELGRVYLDSGVEGDELKAVLMRVPNALRAIADKVEKDLIETGELMEEEVKALRTSGFDV